MQKEIIFMDRETVVKYGEIMKLKNHDLEEGLRIFSEPPFAPLEVEKPEEVQDQNREEKIVKSSSDP